MKKILILILISVSSCIVEKYYPTDFRIKNTSHLDLEFTMFNQGTIFASKIIKKSDENSIGIYNIGADARPDEVVDSIIVRFSDNKILKYNQMDNCRLNKSFFCSDIICTSEVCIFEIDEEEYLNNAHFRQPTAMVLSCPSNRKRCF